jgi:hypothetical protein
MVENLQNFRIDWNGYSMENEKILFLLTINVTTARISSIPGCG